MRRILSFLVVLSMLISPVIAMESTQENDSRSYVLMETSSGTILKEKNKDLSVPPASITKVMTLLLIFDAVEEGKIKWDDLVTVSEHAASMGGSQVFMEAGEQQTVKDMVKCISISSANDATVAMAEHISGRESDFVNLMNKKASELGMNNTVFKNACGLNIDGHVSSAYDVALMSRELMLKHPDITQTSTTWMDSIIHKTRKGESEFGLTNTNKMLKWYNGITGLKTGYTPEAKHCVSATAERNGLELIAVVLGGVNSKTRFREAGALLDYGFANYELKKGPQAGEVIAEVPILKGLKDSVEATVKKSVNFIAAKSEQSPNYEYQVELNPEITAPITKGQEVGYVVCRLDDAEVGRGILVSLEDVDKSGLFNLIKSLFTKNKNSENSESEVKDQTIDQDQSTNLDN
ncbi:MAG: D-alanyl-D-alanine carboxypeptidase [Candidatus Epulonipiscioides saccharophilum]|nr:MAG: D-alanyl-D-alanine carboxypeptidase [Epulopiscium sp. AS2M-Bin001]